MYHAKTGDGNDDDNIDDYRPNKKNITEYQVKIIPKINIFHFVLEHDQTIRRWEERTITKTKTIHNRNDK